MGGRRTPQHSCRPVSPNPEHPILGEMTMVRMARSNWVLSLLAATAWTLGLTGRASAQQAVDVFHRTVKVGDLDIFYREAGPKDAPTILLLHGFPTSSQMFR